MTTEITNKSLLAALVKAQGEMQSLIASETAKAGSYSYTYADLAGVHKTIRQPLAGNGLGVFQFPEVIYESGIYVDVTTTIFHTSGDSLTFPPLRIYAGTAATPQQIGGVITYARRYALMAAFGLAPEDDDAASASQSAAKPPAKQAAPAHRNTAQSNGNTATCPHCHAPAGKPHATGCPNREASQPADALPASLDEVDELNPDPHNPFTSPHAGASSEDSLPYGDIADTLTGDCAKLATWAAGLHANGNGPATKPQYGFLTKTVDKATGDAHTVVLSTLCRRYVNADNPCSKDLAGKLLDFVLDEIPQKDGNGQSVKENGKVVYVANPQYKPAYVECLKAIARAVEAWLAQPVTKSRWQPAGPDVGDGENMPLGY
jgi:cytochrome c553